MSLHYWNSHAQRSRLNELLSLSSLLLAEEAEGWSDDDDMSVDSVDSSLLSLSSTSSSSMDSVSIFESDTSDDSDGTLVDFVVEATVRFYRYIYQPLVDPDINFDTGLPPVIAHLDDAKCVDDFRFRKADLQDWADRLWPKFQWFLNGTHDKIKCTNRYTCPYETGLLLCLLRLSRPRRIRPEIEGYFRKRKTKASAILSTFMEAFCKVALPYFINPAIFLDRFPFYNHLIERKTRLAHLGLWGFIDATLRRTCKPIYYQRLAYSGHKKCHGLKFQTVVTPDGLIALLFGPIAGSRHDSYVLGESQLLPMLWELMPLGMGPAVFAMYGDKAYPQSPYLYGAFRDAQPGSPEHQWNTRMARVREVVEWSYQEIITLWAFLDFKASQKIFKFPVAQYYIVGAFLTNLHTCCYGNKTGNYFRCTQYEHGRLTLAQYIDLVPEQVYIDLVQVPVP